MNRKIKITTAVITGALSLWFVVQSGPVAVAARQALKTGRFEPIQIWVGQEQEPELRQAFQKCLAVRRMDGEAKDLADRYFLETAVRLHRSAEGMPFTGLKPAQALPPDIAAAEKALAVGDISEIAHFLEAEMKKEIKEWFDKAIKAKKHKDESVAAGREWVDAYVKYVIYIHGLHKKIQAGPAHGVGEE